MAQKPSKKSRAEKARGLMKVLEKPRWGGGKQAEVADRRDVDENSWRRDFRERSRVKCKWSRFPLLPTQYSTSDETEIQSQLSQQGNGIYWWRCPPLKLKKKAERKVDEPPAEEKDATQGGSSTTWMTNTYLHISPYERWLLCRT